MPARGRLLTSVQSAHAGWLGATTSTLVVADPSALYCVTVTNQFGCKASDCIYAKFFVLGINELNNWEVKVYPNPTTSVLNIQATQLYPNMQVMIYNENGQLVGRHKLDNLHIFIDVNPEICLKRIHNNRTHIEMYETLDNLIRVRNQYLLAFDQMKDRENIMMVDGNRSEDEIAEEIWSLFKNME